MVGRRNGCVETGARRLDTEEGLLAGGIGVRMDEGILDRGDADAITGFTAQANEYSAYMLIASNFVLNQ
jgi:hypothetical protein